MAAFVSGFPAYPETSFDASASFPHAQPKPIPTPTESQQMQQLEVSGQSVGEIAASLGVPQSEVLSDLGLSNQPSAAATVPTLSLYA